MTPQGGVERRRLSDHPNTSVYLTEEDKAVVAELMQRTGMKRTPLIREALYRMRDTLPEHNESRRQQLLDIAERLRRLA